MKKGLYFILLAALGVLAATGATPATHTDSGNPAALILNKKQAKTIASLKNLADGSLYYMDYKADYKLQNFIDGDYATQGEVKQAVARFLLDPAALKAKMETPKPACSAFQAVTPDGDVIYGRNFDYRFKDSGTVVFKAAPKGGYKSISIASTSFVGLDGHQICDGKTDVSMLVGAPYLQMDGMNEKGLTISVLQISHKAPMQYEEGKHTVMTSVWIRAILDRAATVDEAETVARSFNFSADGKQEGRKVQSNYHFLVSDASGKTRLFEYIMEDGPESNSKWIFNAVDVKAATNSYRSAGWEKYGSQDKRLSKIEGRLAESNGVLTEEEAMSVLDSVHQTATNGHQGKTQWSVVYNLTKKTVAVCINHDYDHIYRFKL